MIFSGSTTLWALCFHGISLSFRQTVVILLLPAANLLLIDFFSRRICQTLVFDLKVEKNNDKPFLVEEKLKTSEFIYRSQVVAHYGEVFQFSLFNLLVVDRRFLLHLVFLIAYYALLINQTTWNKIELHLLNKQQNCYVTQKNTDQFFY